MTTISIALAYITLLIIIAKLTIENQKYMREIMKLERDVSHMEYSILNSRNTDVLPDEVYDKNGNKYIKLYGEFGDTEFMKC